MQPTKIFKVNSVNQNVLKQLLSDKTIAISIVVLTATILFFFGQPINWNIKITITAIIGFISYASLTIELEGQKAYTLIPKLISFLYSPKQIPLLKEAEFKIINNYILSSDKIISVNKIEPIDYLLLNEDEKHEFTVQFRTFLNNLRNNQVQLLVKNRAATEADYLKHLDSVDRQVINFHNSEIAKRREKHLEAYKANLQHLLKNNIIPIRHYYLLVQVPLAKTNNNMSTAELNQLLIKLNDLVNRINRNLSKTKINSTELSGQALEEFLHEYSQK